MNMVMTRINLVTRQLYCFVLMIGIFTFQLGVTAVLLSLAAIPALVIIVLSVFPLSVIFWRTSRIVVREMLALLER